IVLRTTAGISTQAEVVISPATSTRPVVVALSQATRATGSCAKIASSTPSEIWSHSLSGCPSVTDSLVKNAFGFFMKLLKVGLLPSLRIFIRVSTHSSVGGLQARQRSYESIRVLCTRLPRIQVFILFGGEGIDANAHGVEF